MSRLESVAHEAPHSTAFLGNADPAEPESGPMVTVYVDFEAQRAVIQPNSLEISRGERVIWSFDGVPRHYQPHIDIFGFQARGAATFSDTFEPPFEELRSRERGITSGRVTGTNGFYWYEVALVPDRRAQSDEVARLECDPWPEGQPGGRRAAVVEISESPENGR